MRLWSIDPKYLDSKGLVALWREGLLAQKVLAGLTKGYKHHPQLVRFRKTSAPLKSIGTYLFYVAEEASRRGYRFDRSKISLPCAKAFPIMPVTRGQLRYEAAHLLEKLKKRDPQKFQTLVGHKMFRSHRAFRPIAGAVEEWEKGNRKNKKAESRRIQPF